MTLLVFDLQSVARELWVLTMTDAAKTIHCQAGFIDVGDVRVDGLSGLVSSKSTKVHV